MKELIRSLKQRQSSSDDFVANALMAIATFCDDLSNKHQALVEKVAELEGKVSDENQDLRDDVRSLKNDVADAERSINSLESDVRQLERNR